MRSYNLALGGFTRRTGIARDGEEQAGLGGKPHPML